MPAEILILSRSDVAKLLTLGDTITIVEDAFRAHAEGRTLVPALMHIDATGGEFHIKAGGLTVDGKSYFALKSNGGFFGNPALGLPAIQGIIYLADATTGTPVAILDSARITALRTGAATAVAAKYLARPNARTATVIGTGRQARVQLEALGHVRLLDTVYVWDRDPARATAFAAEMTQRLRTTVTAVATAAEGTHRSAIVITRTPAHDPVLARSDIARGTFIAAVGADSSDKQELDPTILRDATVVCDLTQQCAAVGELHHAIREGLMTAADVHAELGQLICGHRPGRSSDDEIIVFDSTGTAIQDAAAAAAAYTRAQATNAGVRVALSA